MTQATLFAMPPEQSGLSARDQSVLDAVAALPLGADGWRRGAFRDELHERAGVSRGAAQRAVDSLVAGGYMERQGVGRSARIPEGFKLTPRGEAAVGQRGPAVSQPVGQPEPVLDSGSMSFSGKEKGTSEPTNGVDRAAAVGQAVGQFGGPALAPLLLEFGADARRILVVGMGAAAGVPVCLCDRLMIQRKGKRGWFWGCVKGKAGCGATAPVRDQPRPPQGSNERGDPRPRDMTNLALSEVTRVLAEQKAVNGKGRAG